jgi:hypothetical protein
LTSKSVHITRSASQTGSIEIIRHGTISDPAGALKATRGRGEPTHRLCKIHVLCYSKEKTYLNLLCPLPALGQVNASHFELPSQFEALGIWRFG